MFHIIFIVPAIFSFDPVWSYGIFVKMVRISIEFKKKNPDMMKQNDFDFRDQQLKVVHKKVLPLNHQILCWPV